MNKVKLISDIMKTMKSKEQVTGAITAEGHGPEMQFSFTKSFDLDQMRHRHGGHHRHFGPMHGMGSHDKMTMAMKEGHTWRDKLNMMSTAMDIFNSIQVEQLEDGNTSLTLAKDQLPDGLIDRIKEGFEKKHEMMKAHYETSGHECEGSKHDHAQWKQHFHKMDNHTINAKVIVNKDREVIQMDLMASGTMDEDDCRMNACIKFD